MKKCFYYIALVLMAGIGYSCENNTNVGNSLSDTEITVVADSSFSVTGYSVEIPRVKSRTNTQLLGVFDAESYGLLASDVVTEMMPVGSIVDEGATEETIDRVRLVMFVNASSGFTGDSIVPMRMTVYKLNKMLPDPIYSDFDPKDYYDENAPLASATYTASDMDKTSDERAAHVYSYYDNSSYSTQYYELREARVELPLEIGRSLLREYKNNPESFNSPESFAKFFPGLYIKSTYGSGRVMNFRDTEVEVLYHRKYKTDFGTDTIVTDSTSMLAATPEVLTNNIISMKVADSIKQAVANGEALLVAPQGYQVDITLPIGEIIAKYNLDSSSLKVINELYLEIPVELIENDHGINPPSNVMLIRTSEKDDFFKENQLTDGCRSYVGTYDSENKRYVFSGLREYVKDILSSGNSVTDDDEHISLIPVDITQESVSSSYSYYYSSASSILTKVAPAVNKPSMVRLDLSKAKIRLTFTKKK
ncbi:MAG: DUF4270 family protein [Muribaculaceae bacterium]